MIDTQAVVKAGALWVIGVSAPAVVTGIDKKTTPVPEEVTEIRQILFGTNGS
jgi:hypothetical protein